MVQALAAEAAREQAEGTGPWINTTSSSTPIYVVGAKQPAVRVALLLPRGRVRAALQAAFRRVPIPADAQPAAGPDRQLTVYQPATGRLWEFFHAERTAEGWRAGWGGAIQHVSHSPGYYSASAWPGATSRWGASATSLPLVGGLMLPAELQRGVIDHALAVALPYPRMGLYAWPAQRSDGTGTEPTDIPEGARLRLDPTLNIPALHLPRLTEVMALAAQRYGIIVRDQTHKGIAFYAEDPVATGHNPYRGPRGIFEGQSPAELLAAFPWSDLEVVAMSLHYDQ